MKEFLKTLYLILCCVTSSLFILMLTVVIIVLLKTDKPDLDYQIFTNERIPKTLIFLALISIFSAGMAYFMEEKK